MGHRSHRFLALMLVGLTAASGLGANDVHGAPATSSTASAPPVFNYPTLHLDRTITTSPFIPLNPGDKPSNPGDVEGLAYDSVRGTMWMADDSKHRLYEVDLASGTLLTTVAQADLSASLELNPVTPGAPVEAGPFRSGDLEGLAYDAVNDMLYVFAGPCCPASPHLPTVFRLTRRTPLAAFAPETFQPLANQLQDEFSGAGAVNGELWAGLGKTLLKYDYPTNTFSTEVPLQLKNNINGVGFSQDGADLWVTTSDDVLHRYDWPNATLRPNSTISMRTLGLGLYDTRAAEVVGDKVWLADGWDFYPQGTPQEFSLQEYSITQDKPAASFTMTPAGGGGAPFTAAFTDTTTMRPQKIQWNWGDGTPPEAPFQIPADDTAGYAAYYPSPPNTRAPVTHTFAHPGTFTVTLTATNLNGTSVATAQVVVTDRPSASFTVTPAQGVSPVVASFSDTTPFPSTILTRSWDFGDNSPTSSDLSPTHTYVNPGIYTATLTVSNSRGSSSTSRSITIQGPPSASFTADVTTGPAPLDVSFTDTSGGTPTPTSWAWDFGDDSPIVTDQNPAHLYAFPGVYNAKLTVSNGIAETNTVKVITVTGSFHGWGPIRLMDTRHSPTIDGNYSGEGPIGPGGSRSVSVVGRGGVPANNIGSVALNITAVGASSQTYLTVWPQGQIRPYASNLNVREGQTIANMVIVPVGSNGNVSIFNENGNVDVIVDLLGWFPTGPVFSGLTPARLMDTRMSPTVDGLYQNGGPIQGGGFKTVHVLGRGKVPKDAVGSLVLNVTVTNTTADSYLTVWPIGFTRPTASNLNWKAGDTVPNLVVVPVPDDGELALYNSAGSADVIVDVLGWFPKAPVFKGLLPVRAMDTRSGTQTIDGLFRGQGAIGARSHIDLKVTGRGISGGVSVPDGGVGAVALNVTAVNPTATSYLTVWQKGESQPTASNLNFVAGQTIANMVIVPVGPSGEISLYNDAGSVDLVVDILGWFPTTV